MATVRRYRSRIAAESAAEALRAEGILASVVGEADALALYGLSNGSGEFAVLIRDAGRREDAVRILSDLDTQPLEPDPGWEDAAEAQPDLSLLDPALDIPCTQCTYDLRRLPRSSAGQIVCPECGATVDCVRAVLRRHGPEALGACYPEPVSLTADDTVDAAPLDCPGCRYPLTGLAQTGTCPECGLPYDKRRILHG